MPNVKFNADGSLTTEGMPTTGTKPEYWKVLSLIEGLEFGIGKHLLADILVGSQSERIDKHQFNLEAHYASLASYTKPQILDFLDTLTEEGLLKTKWMKGRRRYPTVALTRTGKQELDNPSLELTPSSTARLNQSEPIQITENVQEILSHMAEVTDRERKIFTHIQSFFPLFNEEQCKATVDKTNGILCVAGAGSGKTSVLTKRVEGLIKLRSVPPSQILAITFTRKAKESMQQKLAALVPGTPIRIETFNSFCEGELRKHGDLIYTGQTITADYKSKINALNQALKKQKLSMQAAIKKYFKIRQIKAASPRELQNKFLGDAQTVLDYCKITKSDLEQWEKESSCIDEPFDRDATMLICKTARLMDEALHSSNKRDFTDQIMHTLKLYKEHPEAIRTYDYVLIDEYQDINDIQVELINTIAGESIFAVGDPRQSIFGWRGSRLRHILDFPKDHDHSICIPLKVNYRCGKNIIDLVNQVIKPMKLPDLEYGVEDKGKVSIVHYKSEEEESLSIADQIKYMDVPRDEIFILTRTNRQLDTLSKHLRRRGIPHVKRTTESLEAIGDASQGKVTLSTVHAIKGLEADVVFVAGCNKNMYPISVKDHAAIEFIKRHDDYNKKAEELRLLYVALTRARNDLRISYYGKKSTLSTFIPQDVVDIIHS